MLFPQNSGSNLNNYTQCQFVVFASRINSDDCMISLSIFSCQHGYYTDQNDATTFSWEIFLKTDCQFLFCLLRMHYHSILVRSLSLSLLCCRRCQATTGRAYNATRYFLTGVSSGVRNVTAAKLDYQNTQYCIMCIY